MCAAAMPTVRQMRIIAFITRIADTRQILGYIGVETRPPPPIPSTLANSLTQHSLRFLYFLYKYYYLKCLSPRDL
jgi:hypothetical protein